MIYKKGFIIMKEWSNESLFIVPDKYKIRNNEVNADDILLRNLIDILKDVMLPPNVSSLPVKMGSVAKTEKCKELIEKLESMINERKG